MRAAWLLLLLFVAPSAFAQETGSVVVTLDGHDVRDADAVSRALALDVGAPAALRVTITAPADRAWDVAAVRVILLAGAGVPAWSRDLDVGTTIAPGNATVIARDVDLSPLRAVGAGVYRLEARVLDADGGELARTPFFVRVEGNPLLTAAGAVAVALTGVSAYGIWQLLRDLRELNEARKRHSRREVEEGRVARVSGVALDLTGGVSGVLGALEGHDAEAERLERKAPVKWSLTGLGVGGVLMSWAQALGLVAMDVASLLLALAGGAALLLVVGLLVAAWSRRLRRPAEAPQKA
ncbi:MAG: hypothetical protein QOE90_582 [Thermoplasmata archaeon]|nr:hypothetical protein [Thermoplasmata archaeon]